MCVHDIGSFFILHDMVTLLSSLGAFVYPLLIFPFFLFCSIMWLLFPILFPTLCEIQMKIVTRLALYCQ